MKDLDYLNKHFIYTRDEYVDNWNLMCENDQGKLLGDCEDYALWVAYHLLSDKSWMKLFWNILTRKIKFHFVRVRHSNNGHAILEHDGLFIDNNWRRWVKVADMTLLYNFKWRMPLPFILIKLAIGKIIKLFN